MSEVPLRFPPLRSVLYDQTPLDEPVLVTSTVCAPAIRIRHAVLASLLNRVKKTSILLGRAALPDVCLNFKERPEDGVGGEWTLEIDAFDSGNGEDIPKPSETSLSIRAYRPFAIKVVGERKFAVEDALDTWFNVKTRFRSGQSTRLYGMVESVSETRGGFRLRIESFAPSVTLVFRRIPTLVILQNALARKLQSTDKDGELNSQLQYGLLTLNETRKAVLLAEDDPLAYKVPVVGVWFLHGDIQTQSLGAQEMSDYNEERLNSFARAALRDPSVFAGCVRYACNEYLAERVCPPDSPRTFLVCILSGGVPVFMECSISTLDGEKILDCYQATVDIPAPVFSSISGTDVSGQATGQESKAWFEVPNNVMGRIELKQLIEKDMESKEFRLEWMTPTKVPNSNALLKQIEEAMDAQRESRQDAKTQESRVIAPFLHAQSISPPSKEQQSPVQDPALEVALMPVAGRTNLLVDFISKQQQEIQDLRRLVQRLEETVLAVKSESSSRPARATSFEPLDSGDEVSVASFDLYPAENSQAPNTDSEEDISAIEAKYLAMIKREKMTADGDL